MPPVNIESIQLVEQSVVLMENNGSFSKVWVDDDWEKYDDCTELIVEGEPRHIGTELFSKIQDGIDNVKENGEVRVYNGTYKEKIRIYESLKLRANGTMCQNYTTKIEGSILIYSHDVEISNFTITNSQMNGIWVDVRHFSENITPKPVIIKDCIISYHYNGIVVKKNQNLGCKLTNISHNEIVHNDWCGILLEEGSSYNNISNNNIAFNYDGIILKNNNNNNNIFNNNIQFNGRHGIYLYYSFKNIIYNNNIQFNGKGIYYFNSVDDCITYNNISLNNLTGIEMQVFEIENTKIHYNNIYANYEIGLLYNSRAGQKLELKGNFWGKSSGPRIFHKFIYANFPFFLVPTKKGEIIVVTVIGNLKCKEWSNDFNRP